MLHLLFSVGNDNFVIDTTYIKEIIPHLETKPVDGSPSFLLGIQNIRQEPIPIIDFAKLITKKFCENSYFTRIMLVTNPDKKSPLQKIGLLGEKVRETLKLAPSLLEKNQSKGDPTPFISNSFYDKNQIYHVIDIPLFFTHIETYFTKVHGRD